MVRLSFSCIKTSSSFFSAFSSSSLAIILKYNISTCLYHKYSLIIFSMPVFLVYFLLFVIIILLSFIIFLRIEVESSFIYLYYFSICSHVHPFILQVPIILILNVGSKQLCFICLLVFLSLFFIQEVFLLTLLGF